MLGPQTWRSIRRREYSSASAARPHQTPITGLAVTASGHQRLPGNTADPTVRAIYLINQHRRTAFLLPLSMPE